MSVLTKPIPFGFVPPPFPRPQIELVESDGEPLESQWHVYAFNLLIELAQYHFRDRPNDFFSGGNMFIYFSEEQARNRDFRGPDFFFVWGRPSTPARLYWAVWDEEWHFPNVIIELLSPSTRKEDLGVKKDLYQDGFKTEDYFCYDPDRRQLLGWTLTPSGYVELEPNDRGQLWSEQLGLWVGPARGVRHNLDMVWLRFFTPDGRLVPTFEEAEAQRANAAELELVRLKAELESRDKPAS